MQGQPLEKGKPGYMKHHRRMYGLISYIGFALITVIFTISYIILKTPRNYFNIASVLILLPTVKFYVQYLMIPKNNYVDGQQYETLHNKLGVLPFSCELLMTGSEKCFEILYLAVDPDENIIAYSRNLKSDVAAFEKAVVLFLNYYNFDAKVKLYLDYDKFHSAVQDMAERNMQITEEQLEHAGTVMSKVLIMSI